MSSSQSSQSSSTTKPSAFKLVVKSRKKAPAKRKVGLPSAVSNRAGLLPAVTPVEDDEFPTSSADDNDIPCDTLMVMRSIVEKRQCVHLPLKNGSLIAAVLESQIYAKLPGLDGEDSIATCQIQELCRENRLRQLLPSSSSMGIVALIETNDFIKAVWDASHQSTKSNATFVTTWFVSNLPAWTKQRISRHVMEQEWKQSNASLDSALDTLVDMQVLLPSTIKSSFFLWLPNWGPVLASLSKAQTQLMALIKRSLHKELSEKQILTQSHARGALSGAFVLHTLTTIGKVEIVTRPSGEFARIPK